jgi:hypothetical protein
MALVVVGVHGGVVREARAHPRALDRPGDRLTTRMRPRMVDRHHRVRLWIAALAAA